MSQYLSIKECLHSLYEDSGDLPGEYVPGSDLSSLDASNDSDEKAHSVFIQEAVPLSAEGTHLEGHQGGLLSWYRSQCQGDSIPVLAGSTGL